VEIKEKLYFFREWTKNLGTPDLSELNDKITDILATLEMMDKVNMYDDKLITTIFMKNDLVPLYDRVVDMIVYLAYNDKVLIKEGIFDIIRWFTRNYNEKIDIHDNAIFKSVYYLDDYYRKNDQSSGIRDKLYAKYYLFDKEDRVFVNDKFSLNTVTLELSDYYNLVDGYYITRTYQ
jgi:hypothetical protein